MAQEALQAATLLLERGLPNSAANRAYYAAFHAARAALVAAGVSSPMQAWSHEGIQTGIFRLTRRQKLYPAHLGRMMARLRSLREVADYKLEVISSRMAREAVKSATEFVAYVQAGIQR